MSEKCPLCGGPTAYGRPTNEIVALRDAQMKAAYERETVALGLVSDLVKILKRVRESLHDHDSVGGRRYTEANVFPECGREFPGTIGLIDAALAAYAAAKSKDEGTDGK